MPKSYKEAVDAVKEKLLNFVEETWEEFGRYCQENNIQEPNAWGFKQFLIEKVNE